jgi:hypothetical protein
MQKGPLSSPDAKRSLEYIAEYRHIGARARHAHTYAHIHIIINTFKPKVTRL